MVDANGREFDGYINEIRFNGKVYKFRCDVVEVYSMTCPKCGGNVTLKYGSGKCDFCGTNYTTNFKLEEVH